MQQWKVNLIVPRRRFLPSPPFFCVVSNNFLMEFVVVAVLFLLLTFSLMKNAI